MELTPKEREVLGQLEKLSECYHELERMEHSSDTHELFDARFHLRALRRTIIHRAAIREFPHLDFTNHSEPKTVYSERVL